MTTRWRSCYHTRGLMDDEPEWGLNMLAFLAVGRLKDSALLAHYIAANPTKQQENTKVIFKQLLDTSSGKLRPGEFKQLQWGHGSVCILMDQDCKRLYCLVTAHVSYPDALAKRLLADLMKSVTEEKVDFDLDAIAENALNPRVAAHMYDLIAYYEDAENFPQYEVGALGIEPVGDLEDEQEDDNHAQALQEPPRKCSRRLVVFLFALVMGVLLILLLVSVLQGTEALAKRFSAAEGKYGLSVPASTAAAVLDELLQRAVIHF